MADFPVCMCSFLKVIPRTAEGKTEGMCFTLQCLVNTGLCCSTADPGSCSSGLGFSPAFGVPSTVGLSQEGGLPAWPLLGCHS